MKLKKYFYKKVGFPIDKCRKKEYNKIIVIKRTLRNDDFIKRRAVMPPKPKYTKEQIITAALEIVAKNGIEFLTAKELGCALNTSTSPIFTVFDSMQEVQEAVKIAAMKRFESYAHKTDADMPIFKQIGMRMILFAEEEPQLYRLIFMSHNGGVKSFDDIYAYLGSVADECLEAIQKDYGLSVEKAKMLFEHSWIYTFGIGTLCATGMCVFSKKRISEMLTQNFTAMMMLLKGEFYENVK